MQITDRDIKRIAKGDIQAFEKFFEAFYPSLCKFSNGFLESKDIAADIAQDAMIKFWNNRAVQSTIKQAKVYLFTIVRNNCINYTRHQKVVDNHRLKYAENKEFINAAYIEDEVFDLLRTAVKKLPPQSKNIILLALEGLANKEIAEELKISINTVKSLKKTAYSTLRELLKNKVYALVILYVYLFG